jgi:hypothetical protein
MIVKGSIAMKKIAIVLLVSMMFGVFGFHAVFGGDIPVPDAQKSLLDYINAYRKTNGLKPIEFNQKLMLSAQMHSAEMAYTDNLTHDSVNGRSFQDRMDELDIEYSVIVENVAMNAGPDYPKMAFEQWKKSPPHNANMLKAELTDAGFGFGKSKKGLWYITFDGMKITEQKQTVNVSESLAFACQGQTTQVGITFNNTRQQAMQVKVTVSYKQGSGWVAIPANIAIPPSTKKVINLTLNAAKLNPGTYSAIVTSVFGNITYVKPIKFVVTKIVCKLTCPTSQMSVLGKKGTSNNYLATLTNLSECQVSAKYTVISSNRDVKIVLDKSAGNIAKKASQNIKVTLTFQKDLAVGTKIVITFTAVVAGIGYTSKRTVVVKR